MNKPKNACESSLSLPSMKGLPLLLVLAVVVLALPVCNAACVNLTNSSTYQGNVQGNMTNGFTVNGSITLCKGTYAFSGVAALTVNATNVTINCNGSSITGNGAGYGVYSTMFNTTVENCNISGFYSAIYFDSGANNGTILDNNLNSTPSAGATIMLAGSNNAVLFNNVYNSMSDAGEFIAVLLDGTLNNVSYDNISGGYLAVYIASNNNTITYDNISSGAGHSPGFSATAHATLAEPQVFGYVEETTRRSGGHTKGDDVNRWGRQIRVKMVWLPERNRFP